MTVIYLLWEQRKTGVILSSFAHQGHMSTYLFLPFTFCEATPTATLLHCANKTWWDLKHNTQVDSEGCNIRFPCHPSVHGRGTGGRCGEAGTYCWRMSDLCHCSMMSFPVQPRRAGTTPGQCSSTHPDNPWSHEDGCPQFCQLASVYPPDTWWWLSATITRSPLALIGRLVSPMHALLLVQAL